MADKKLKYKTTWVNGDLYVTHVKTGLYVMRIVKKPRLFGIFGRERFKLEYVAKPDINNFKTFVEAERFMRDLLGIYEEIFKSEPEITNGV